MIRLITNQSSKTSHEALLRSLLEQALEVNIAVAFFKDSGYNFLAPYFQRDIKFSIMAGVNFALTDPTALARLLEDKAGNSNLTVFIGKLKCKVIFHSKLYMIRTKDGCHIISGSSNMTAGGLSNNNESSLYVQCHSSDQIWKDTWKYFQDCTGDRNADVLGKKVLELYIQYHSNQSMINRQIKPFPDVDEGILGDQNKLIYLFSQLDKTKLEQAMTDRTNQYRFAVQVLDQLLLADPKSAEFMKIFQQLLRKGELYTERLWVSNGIARRSNDVHKNPEKLQELIRAVKDNIGQPPEVIYDAALAVTRGFKGVKAAFIGEIMMTYDYVNLANINGNPLLVLRKNGGEELPEYSHEFTGVDYVKYLGLVRQIVATLNLRNMLEADYFFEQVFRGMGKQQSKSKML